MNHQPGGPSPDPCSSPQSPTPSRLFLHEPGWQIDIKRGHDRTFCHMMAPGQDYYHRIADGELFLSSDDEQLCIPCAMRRGLLANAPRRLRPSPNTLIDPADASDFALAPDESERPYL